MIFHSNVYQRAATNQYVQWIFLDSPMRYGVFPPTFPNDANPDLQRVADWHEIHPASPGLYMDLYVQCGMDVTWGESEDVRFEDDTLRSKICLVSSFNFHLVLPMSSGLWGTETWRSAEAKSRCPNVPCIWLGSLSHRTQIIQALGILAVDHWAPLGCNHNWAMKNNHIIWWWNYTWLYMILLSGFMRIIN